MKLTDTSQHPSHCTITTCNLTNTIEFTHSIKKISVVTKEKINANNKKRTKTMLQMLSRINTLWLTCSRTDAGAARTYDFNSEELSCYWLKKGEHIKSKKKNSQQHTTILKFSRTDLAQLSPRAANCSKQAKPYWKKSGGFITVRSRTCTQLMVL